jgi:hypothetical protein
MHFTEYDRVVQAVSRTTEIGVGRGDTGDFTLLRSQCRRQSN